MSVHVLPAYVALLIPLVVSRDGVFFGVFSLICAPKFRERDVGRAASVTRIQGHSRRR